MVGNLQFDLWLLISLPSSSITLRFVLASVRADELISPSCPLCCSGHRQTCVSSDRWAPGPTVTSAAGEVPLRVCNLSSTTRQQPHGASKQIFPPLLKATRHSNAVRSRCWYFMDLFKGQAPRALNFLGKFGLLFVRGEI